MLSQKERQRIAETTITYLGGQRTIKAFVNARDFVVGENGELAFRFTGSSKTNYVKFSLNVLDLYDVTFYRIRGEQMKEHKDFSNLYFDQLKSIFEEVTGLYLGFR